MLHRWQFMILMFDWWGRGEKSLRLDLGFDSSDYRSILPHVYIPEEGSRVAA